MPEEIEIFYPTSLAAWREWLEKNHSSKQSVRLVCYNKKSKNKSISWSDSVDVALCFGWIDSKKIKIDEETAHQFFSKRKAKSTWSKINKEKIAKLTAQGLMTPAGLEAVAVAKQNNSWTILDEVEALIIPKDLAQAFDTKPGSRDFFNNLSKSVRKVLLQKLVLAKLPATRQKRINEIIELASKSTKTTEIN